MPFPTPPTGGFPEDRVLWVFGHPRSGTTWLGQLLADGLNLKMWNEPYLGQILGFANLLRDNEPGRFDDPTFWMAHAQEENWRASLNLFFMDVIARQAGPAQGYAGLAIKEPNGTVVAPLIVKAMPEAKFIFMIRDPRDVIASLIDARKPGSWMGERVQEQFNRTKVVNQSIKRFQRIAEGLKDVEALAPTRLYEMRYERMRHDPFAELKHLAFVLGLPCDERVLRSAIERHDYERIPAERKGPGRFVRTAKVGGWRAELEESEINAIHTQLGGFLTDLGYLDGPR